MSHDMSWLKRYLAAPAVISQGHTKSLHSPDCRIQAEPRRSLNPHSCRRRGSTWVGMTDVSVPAYVRDVLRLLLA